MQIQMKNQWRVRLHEGSSSQDVLNKEMRMLLKRQVEALPPGATNRDILVCVQGLWRDDI